MKKGLSQQNCNTQMNLAELTRNPLSQLPNKMNLLGRTNNPAQNCVNHVEIACKYRNLPRNYNQTYFSPLELYLQNRLRHQQAKASLGLEDHCVCYPARLLSSASFSQGAKQAFPTFHSESPLTTQVHGTLEGDSDQKSQQPEQKKLVVSQLGRNKLFSRPISSSYSSQTSCLSSSERAEKPSRISVVSDGSNVMRWQLKTYLTSFE